MAKNTIPKIGNGGKNPKTYYCAPSLRDGGIRNVPSVFFMLGKHFYSAALTH